MILVWTCLFAALGGFLFGYDLGLIGGALLQIERYFHIRSSLTKGMVVGAAKMGAAGGTFLGGAMMARYGRQRALALNSLAFAAGPLIMAAASAPWLLVLGRFVVGIGIGVSATVSPVYIAELAPAAIRGTLVQLYEVMLCIGMLSAPLVDWALSRGDTYSSWRIMVGLPAIPGLVLAAAPLVLPESPRWLVMRNRLDEALQVLTTMMRGKFGAASCVEVLWGGGYATLAGKELSPAAAAALAAAAEERAVHRAEEELLQLWSNVELDRNAVLERRRKLWRSHQQNSGGRPWGRLGYWRGELFRPKPPSLEPIPEESASQLSSPSAAASTSHEGRWLLGSPREWRGSPGGKGSEGGVRGPHPAPQDSAASPSVSGAVWGPGPQPPPVRVARSENNPGVEGTGTWGAGQGPGSGSELTNAGPGPETVAAASGPGPAGGLRRVAAGAASAPGSPASASSRGGSPARRRSVRALGAEPAAGESRSPGLSGTRGGSPEAYHRLSGGDGMDRGLGGREEPDGAADGADERTHLLEPFRLGSGGKSGSGSSRYARRSLQAGHELADSTGAAAAATGGVQEEEDVEGDASGAPFTPVSLGTMPGEEATFLHTVTALVADIWALAGGPERRALWLALGLAFFDQITASTAIINYAPSLLRRLEGGDQVDEGGAMLYTVAIAVFKAIGVVAALLLVDRCGRRPLLIAGSLTCAVALLGLTAASLGGSAALLAGAMCIYTLFFSLSWAGLYWVVVSELFSMTAKSAATSAATALLFLTGAVTNMVFLTLRDLLGAYVFLLFSGLCLASAGYVWMRLPETKGRTLVEVQEMLSVQQPRGGDGVDEDRSGRGGRSGQYVQLQERLPRARA